jgi:hypothetical protein
MPPVPVPALAPVVVSGVSFEPVQTPTFEQSIYLTTQARQAGLFEQLDRYNDMELEQRALAILSDVYDSGRTMQLLAAVLTRTGEPWSKEKAAENATLFAQCSEPASITALTAALVELLWHFFPSAASSLPTSPSSSEKTTAADPDDPSAAPSTTTSGEPSSAPSADSTPNELATSSAGLSAKDSSPIESP